jgi:hypothetical protein
MNVFNAYYQLVMESAKQENKTGVKCPNCGDDVFGRIDKKFCSPYCKSNYHYSANVADNSSYLNIDKQLKINRRLLKDFNRAGKSTVRKEVLIKAGFNDKYITHWWKNKKGDTYRFCYEYGYLPRVENGKEKFVLIQWQDYMNVK